MSLFKSLKSKPINIPKSKISLNKKDIQHISLQNYKDFEYEIPDYNSPKKIKRVSSKNYLYSNDNIIPDPPFGKTPPNSEKFKRMYMDMFANIYLSCTSSRD